MQLPEGHIWPRVSLDGGESVRLCDALEGMELGAADVLAVIGPPGSGRTTTLNLLRGWRADLPEHCFADEPARDEACHGGRAVVGPFLYAADALRVGRPTRVLRLARWSDDDVIELVLTRYRAQAKGILSRLLASPSRGVMEGLAAVVSAVVDEFAARPEMLSVAEAVRGWCGLCAEGGLCAGVGQPTPMPLAIIMQLLRPNAEEAAAEHTLAWMHYRPVARLVLAEAVHSALAARDECTWLNLRFERSFLSASGEAIKGDWASIEYLLELLKSGALFSHATAAGLLHLVGAGLGGAEVEGGGERGASMAEVLWWPSEERRWMLRGAVLPGIAWAGVKLVRANLASADLNGADLAEATLTDVDMSRARLRGARLTKAMLARARLADADLSGADLTDACLVGVTCTGTNMENVTATRADLRGTFANTNLTGARLVRANFSGAALVRVVLDDADCSGASFDDAQLREIDLRRCRLEGAHFRGAQISTCNFEELVMPAAEFAGALLLGTDFTASVMRNANFAGARLHRCGLADVQWEDVDLRGANLGKSTFHMGSSRSGLLFSPIASEGTRTGFYTEDCNDLTHKKPEEIRKANLCGADLRGAKVMDTDFYLVDLRGARFSDEQVTWFRKCGAILEG